MGVVLFIMLTGFQPFQIAKKGDRWFDRIEKSQHKYFWKAHLGNCNVSELAQGVLHLLQTLNDSLATSVYAIVRFYRRLVEQDFYRRPC